MTPERNKTILTLFTLCLLLAGCTGQLPPDGASPGADEDPRAVPVDHSETIDLYPRATEREWNFTVPRGFSEGLLLVALEDASGASAPAVEGAWCLSYRTPSAQGQKGTCGTANMGVAVGGALEDPLLFHQAGDAITPGEHWFRFESQPQPARLVIEFQVQP